MHNMRSGIQKKLLLMIGRYIWTVQL